MPPESLCYEARGRLERFEPDPKLEAWIRAHFIEPDGALFRAEHKHLARALIGCLWTNVPLSKQQMDVAATAEMPSAQGNRWARARFNQQLRQWFGIEPHFLITFFAPESSERDDASFCALVRHELMHCGQKRTREGAPAFNKDGLPIFAMRGHDVEEHVAVIEDFGVYAAAGRSVEFYEAAKRAPKVAPARIAIACGTCLK